MAGKLWQTWLYHARLIGNFQARALITLVYFTLLAPFGVLVRLLSDPLSVKRPTEASAWIDRQTYDLDIDHARRQG